VLAVTPELDVSSLQSVTLSLQIGNDAGSTTLRCIATPYAYVNSSSSLVPHLQEHAIAHGRSGQTDPIRTPLAEPSSDGAAEFETTASYRKD